VPPSKGRALERRSASQRIPAHPSASQRIPAHPTASRALVPLRAAVGRAGGELPVFLRLEEVERAIATLEVLPVPANAPRLRLLIRFLWLTGARISEALAVLVGAVDFRTKLVKLVTLKRRSASSRTVPLPPEFLGELAMQINTEALRDGDRLFGWSRSRAFELIRDALLAAGVERARCHPHALRHGHAVHALERGAPLNIVQRVLGHSSVVTTSIYITATADDVRRHYRGMEW
jgi:integrase/recombinase XerD